MTTGVGGRGFALVTGGFTFVFSLLLPSFHGLPRHVLFEFIEGNSSGFPADAQMRLWFSCVAIGEPLQPVLKPVLHRSHTIVFDRGRKLVSFGFAPVAV